MIWYLNGTFPIKQPFGVYSSRVDSSVSSCLRQDQSGVDRPQLWRSVGKWWFCCATGLHLPKRMKFAGSKKCVLATTELYNTVHLWLVVWNSFYDFPYIGNNHSNWLSYFSEGLKPPTRSNLADSLGALQKGQKSSNTTAFHLFRTETEISPTQFSNPYIYNIHTYSILILYSTCNIYIYI